MYSVSWVAPRPQPKSDPGKRTQNGNRGTATGLFIKIQCFC